MDHSLQQKLVNLNAQNERLTAARGKYLLNEAQRKHFESKLIQEAAGKSQAEKTVNAQASEKWLSFHLTLADLENKYEFEKLRYDILDKAFQAEYLSLKLDTGTIKRQGA